MKERGQRATEEIEKGWHGKFMGMEAKGMGTEELNRMGLAFVKSKQVAEALKYFNKAIDADPEYLVPYYNKAMVLSMSDKPDEAIACYDLILGKDASQGEACYQKANLLFFYLENGKDAVELYNKAIYLGYKNADVYFHLGLCMEASGMTEEALKWVERAFLTDRKNAGTILKKAELLTTLKRFFEAIECYNQVLLLESDNEKAFHFKAILLAEVKKSNEALKTLSEAEEVIGARLLFEYDRALVYESQGRYEEALLHTDRGLEMDSGNTMLLVKKGSLLSSAGRYDAAKNIFDEVYAMDPDNKEGRFNKAMLHVLLKEYGEACKLLDEIIEKADEKDPYKVNAYYYRAFSLKNDGRQEEAKKAFEEARRIYSALSATYTYDIQLMLLKANTLRELQRYREAGELYEYVIDLDKNLPDPYLMRAKNFIYTGELNKARKDMELAISINPAYRSLVDLDEDLKSVYNSKQVGRT